jgi:uroporphyrinogen decarboxylase
MSKIFLDACLRKKTPYTPVWMMRQAGRYLTQYLEVRKKAGSFLNLCHNAKLACEVTLQPLDILDVDAAILFSDILVIPNEMGMHLEFIKNRGPFFKSPIRNIEDLDDLIFGKYASSKLTYVYDTIKLVKQKLPNDKALIGFTGSPWTLTTYMIEGEGTKTYNICKKLIYTNPKLVHQILEKLTITIQYYLEEQINSGVDVVQIFDSWAGAIEPDLYDEFSYSYMIKIVDYIKNKYPNIPIILFPKGISTFLHKVYGNFDVFGVDWSTPMYLAKKYLGHKYVLQGNMEPCRLYSKEYIKEYVNSTYKLMQNDGHIFNLGHGILPDVSVDNAKYFINECKKVSHK